MAGIRIIGVVALSIAVASLQPADAAVFTGEARGTDFAFLGKFCFGYNDDNKVVGTVSGHITTEQRDVNMYFYDDQPSQWPAVWGSDLTCQEKISEDHHAVNAVAWVNTTGGWDFNFEFVEHTRVRYWYVALALSNCRGDVDVRDFELTFLNQPGNSQYSVAQYGLWETYGVNLIVNAVVLFVVVTALRQLTVTPIVLRLYTISILLHAGSCLLLLVHWATFGKDGMGVPALVAIGDVLEVLSIAMFWMMAALVAVGFGISVHTLEQHSVRVGLSLTAALILVYLAFSVWYALAKDPASSAYEYDSLPGAAIVCVNIGFFAWWALKLRSTWVVEFQAHKRSVYVKFAIVVGSYFFITPATVAAGTLVQPWVRQRVTLGVLTCFRGVVNLALAYLFWPTTSERFFRVPQLKATLRDIDADPELSRYAQL